ncbi:hypothetical protein HOLleu_34894 [Holothuria leucospilota]|uniref:CCHC-type domain-containing protein n=1 Tax=Holothuria leucospilota TaxID=206669 RepID=A0A9Q1BEJ5_HOLLE|nr:hypothetical protein HOLleu_34894 [Holothuria leucospilota]
MGGQKKGANRNLLRAVTAGESTVQNTEQSVSAPSMIEALREGFKEQRSEFKQSSQREASNGKRRGKFSENCYMCWQPGHMARNCRDRDPLSPQNQQPRSRSKPNSKGHVCQHETWVGGIAGDGIIGHDFQKKFDGHISVEKGILSIKGQLVSCKKNGAGVLSCGVDNAENHVLPPRNEVITAVVRGNPAEQRLALVEMSDFFMNKHNVLVARALVDPSVGNVLLRAHECN